MRTTSPLADFGGLSSLTEIPSQQPALGRPEVADWRVVIRSWSSRTVRLRISRVSPTFFQVAGGNMSWMDPEPSFAIRFPAESNR